MGKAARSAAAERKPDHRPPHRAEPDLVGTGSGRARANSPTLIVSLRAHEPNRCCVRACQNLANGMVYTAISRGLRRDCDCDRDRRATGAAAGSPQVQRLVRTRRLEFAAFSVKSMPMTPGGNGIDGFGRRSRLTMAFALLAVLRFSASGRCSGPNVHRSAAAGAAGARCRTPQAAAMSLAPLVGPGVDSDPAGTSDPATASPRSHRSSRRRAHRPRARPCCR